MHARRPQLWRLHRHARSAALAVVLAGLAGCAASLPSRPAYVGMFTGEYVDGLPLYRFPSVEVIGSRRGVTGEPSKGLDPG